MNGNEHDISIQTLPLTGELEGAAFLGRGWSFPPVLTEQGVLLIRLTYTVIRTNNRHNMIYPFYINEGTSITTK